MAGTRINSNGGLGRRAARGNTRRDNLYAKKDREKKKKEQDTLLLAEKNRRQELLLKTKDNNNRAKDRAASLKMRAMELGSTKTPFEQLQGRVALGDKRFATDASKYTKGSGSSGLMVNGKSVQTRGRKYNKDYLAYSADKNDLYTQTQDAKKATAMKGINEALAKGGTYKKKTGSGEITFSPTKKTTKTKSGRGTVTDIDQRKGPKKIVAERKLLDMNASDLQDILTEVSGSAGEVAAGKARDVAAGKNRTAAIANQKAILGALEKEIQDPNDPMRKIINPEYAKENQIYLDMLRGKSGGGPGQGGSGRDYGDFVNEPAMMSSHQPTTPGATVPPGADGTVASILNSSGNQPPIVQPQGPPVAQVPGQEPMMPRQQPAPQPQRASVVPLTEEQLASQPAGILKQNVPVVPPPKSSVANEWAFDAGVGAMDNLTWAADNLLGGKGVRMAGNSFGNVTKSILSRVKADFTRNKAAGAERGARARKMLSQN